MTYPSWKNRQTGKESGSARSYTDYGYAYGDVYSGYTHDYGYGYGPPPVDIRKALAPLIRQLETYDTLRLKLEREGGSVKDLLGAISAALNAPLKIAGRYEEKEACLKNQPALQEALRNVDYDIHLDIRLRPGNLPTPVYYLCRTHRDYWGEYGLIVEDLYMSTGYPLPDPRFARFMSGGHEVYYLRLSQFRKETIVSGDGGEEASDRKKDQLLYDLGRHVFQAAWHEDQRLGVTAADALGLRRFREAVELLYLCLSGELCELRSASNETMLRFFGCVYPNAAIRAFLEKLAGLDGARLNDIPRRAGELYKKLLKSFQKFLAVEVTWGPFKLRTPLWKLLYGNFSRFHLVGHALLKDRCLAEAIMNLEKASQAVIDDLLGRCDGPGA